VGNEDAAIAIQRLAELADESGLAFGELVEMWSEDTRLQLRLASAALVAGDLREAARLIHGASGSSGMCGVTALAEQLRMVENLAVEGRGGDAQQVLASAQVRFAGISGALHAVQRPAPTAPSAAAPRA
jgi:HPt (histidine-containing phosphotransfer) domain-containing protein